MSVNRIFSPKAQKSKKFDLKFEWSDEFSVDTMQTRGFPMTSAILKWPTHVKNLETGLKIQVKFKLLAVELQTFTLEIVPLNNNVIKVSKLYQKLSIIVKFKKIGFPDDDAVEQRLVLEQSFTDGMFEIDLNNISSKETKLDDILTFYDDPCWEHKFEFKAQIQYVDKIPKSLKKNLLKNRFFYLFLNEHLSDMKVRILFFLYKLAFCE